MSILVSRNPPITPEAITAQLLKDECGAGAYERGLGYFRQGRTVIEDIEVDEEGGFILYSTSRGSGGHFYDQVVILNSDPRGPIIDGACTCPVEYNCKHVVAVCLAWKDERWSDYDTSGAFERWLDRLGDGRAPQDEPSGEALLYILSTAREGGTVVGFVVAKRKADGRWSKGRKAPQSIVAPHFSSRHQYSGPRYMCPEDTEIMALLRATEPVIWSDTVVLRGAAGHAALMLMAKSGRAFWDAERQRPLCPGEPRQLTLAWEELRDGYRLGLKMEGEGEMVVVDPPCYIDPGRPTVGELQLPQGVDAERLVLLAQAPDVNKSEAERISRRLALELPELPTPTPVAVDEIHGPPTPRLALHLDPERPWDDAMTLSFRYGDHEVEAGEPAALITREQEGRLQRIHRDPAAEAAAGERLLDSGQVMGAARAGRFALRGERPEHPVAMGVWFRFLEAVVPGLEQDGWIVLQVARNVLTLDHAEVIDAEVESSDNDWFSLRFDLEVDGKRLPLLPLVSELLGDYRPGTLPQTLYLDAGGGHYVAVPGERLEPVLQTIVDLFDRDQGDGEGLRLSRLDAPRLLELGETRVRGGQDLQKMAERLRDFDGIKPVEPPTTFHGVLRPYQQRGLDWLQFLREYQLAGILADDMGLGKTVQTLAHLAVEKRAGRMDRPALIVAPTSLMGNWRREAAQFTPELEVLVLQGPGRDRYFDTIGDHDLVLTTYPLLPRDREVLLEWHWHYLILDEAQQIKNPKSQAAQLVRAMKADHRLCLTGTPMENHLGELWAQFDFLLPGFLGDQQGFAHRYRTPIEKQGDGDKLERLTRRIAPFMLRRTKGLVAGELPAKTELLRTVPLEGRQAALYESIRLTMEKRVRDAIANKGLARSHITILDALLKLRQVCCDPRLLPAGGKGTKDAGSAKLEMLMELLPEMLDEGRRILLFSQFTTMLGLIEKELQGRDIPYAKLTGQTRKREEAIETFRSGAVNLFLISLKAGGVGLNLTEADTVVHYDPWWNPAVETQATDRAHRIGQHKPVFVYKLITEATVEERILALQDKKRKLADNIYGRGKKARELPIDAETIESLLAGD
ncbi:MAG: DEAD/DEAH box helicase [Gammaproteobacteria bacterium]|nr:DEAD/DEAH box helicase [Gammaproteobacteria bacterium]